MINICGVPQVLCACATTLPRVGDLRRHRAQGAQQVGNQQTLMQGGGWHVCDECPKPMQPTQLWLTSTLCHTLPRVGQLHPRGGGARTLHALGFFSNISPIFLGFRVCYPPALL
jgi:hypothetical protein